MAKQSLIGITVSVNYADFFCWAAPHNKTHFDKWIIVTDTKDKITKQICNYYNITCIETDIFYENHSTFNKYKGINVALEKTKKSDWVYFLDSDIILPPLTRRILDNIEMQQDCIYGCDRLNVKGFQQWMNFMTNPNNVVDNWLLTPGGLELGSRIVHYYGQKGDNGKFGGWKPLGFTQIAHRSQFDTYPDNSKSADHCDIVFANEYDRNKRIFIPELLPLHLESDNAKWGSNWSGRKTAQFQSNNKEIKPSEIQTSKIDEEIVYKDYIMEKELKYVDGETPLSKYLKVKDFTFSNTAIKNGIDNRLPTEKLADAKKIALLYDKIYEAFNGNIVLNSGYRNEKLNNKVGGSKTSQHKLAQAIDVKGKNGVKNKTILEWVKKNLTYNQLIWEFGTSVEPAWVHVGYGTKMQFLKITSKDTKSLFTQDGYDI